MKWRPQSSESILRVISSLQSNWEGTLAEVTQKPIINEVLFDYFHYLLGWWNKDFYNLQIILGEGKHFEEQEQNSTPSHFGDQIETNKMKTTLKKAKSNAEITSIWSMEQMPRRVSGIYSNHELNTSNNAILLQKELLKVSHYSTVSTSRPQQAEAYLLSLDWIHLGSLIRLMQWTYKRQCQLIWHSGFLGEKTSTIFFSSFVVFEEKGSSTRLAL